MKPAFRRLCNSIVTSIMLFTMLYTLVIPASTFQARAQEVTETAEAEDVATEAAPEPEITESPTAEIPTETPLPEVTSEATSEATAEITPETTVEATAEVTPETTVEATAEITPESTVEATAEVTPETTAEATPEATLEPTAIAPQIVLSADFESDLAGWSASETAAVVELGDGNHALQMTDGSMFAPSELLYLADFHIDGRLNLSADASNRLNINFRVQETSSYRLLIEAAKLTLYRDDGTGEVEVSSVDGATGDDWQTFSLDAQGGHIVAVVGETVLDVTEDMPLLSGQFSFTANGDSAVLLDDVVVTAYTDVQVIPTPTPLTLSIEALGKIDSPLQDVLNLYLSGDEAGANTLASDVYLMPMDENGLLSVVVWAAEGQTSQTISPLIETVGGVIDGSDESSVSAKVSLGSLIALTSVPEIRAILLPEVAVSTSPNASTLQQNDEPLVGTVNSHGVNIVGAATWLTANNPVSGSGANIAVIDTGFAGIASVNASDRACLANTTPVGGAGTGSHGVNVVEVICDIAPTSRVTMYQADNAAELSDQIKAADNSNRVIVITMDLGVNASPGDGTFGRNSADDPYEAITAARNAGVLVIAAAGNNNGRYVTLNYTGAATTIPLNDVSPGDLVNVSWSDWAAPSALTRTLSGSGITVINQATIGGTPSGTMTVPAQGTCGNPDPCNLSLQISGPGTFTLQVQITGTGSIGTVSGASVVGGTGTMGRPADSPDVIAVGAVCSAPAENYPVLESSSRGPIFASGGNGPAAPAGAPIERYKPDLMGPSHVNTTQETATSGCVTEPTDGFNGTSAAAAHVAGMAALLISNTNASMDSFNTGANADDALESYLVTHTIDLFTGATADGFDNTHGAGLTTLGSPTYDLSQVTQPAALGGGVIYVGSYNAASANTGTLTDPYIHPSWAMQQANSGQTVILTPGEYVTPVLIQGKSNVTMRSYDAATGIDAPDSVFWVNNEYDVTGELSAGINVRNSTLVTVDGFIFNPATISAVLNPPYVFNVPQGVAFFNNTTSILSNSTFTAFTEIPVQTRSEEGLRIENNVFSGGATVGGLTSGISLDDSGTGNSIRIQFNNFASNSGDVGITTAGRGSIIRLQGSAAEIFNNRFTSNNSFSLIRVNNLESTVYEVRIFSNLFQSNSLSGPIVHLQPGPRLRFINNSLIQNTMTNSEYGGGIIRGQVNVIDPNDEDGGGQWDIHNNLLWSNNFGNGFINDITDDFQCDSIGGAADDSGAQNNWAFPGNIASGDCGVALSDPANNNILYVDIDDPIPPGYNPYKNPAYQDPANPNDTSAFVGLTLDPNDPFRLVLQPDPNNFGIDTGNNALISSWFPDGLTAARDLLDNTRVEDGNNDSTDVIDIGAYELVPLSANPIEVTCVEDVLTCVADLNEGAEGGFGAYTFSLVSQATNYSTTTTDACGGDGLALSGSLASYCPPRDFYTEDPPAYPILPGATVEFQYSVEDATNAPAVSSTVTMYLTPLDDPTPTVDIPDYTVVTDIDTAITFRLRPYVRFENFRLSDPTTATQAGWVDYPFDYTFGSVTAGDSSIFGGDGAISGAVNGAGLDSRITLNVSGSQDEDFVTFTYNAEDADGNTQPVTVTIRVLNLPDVGLQDDTSFAFSYYGAGGEETTGGWLPGYNETSINNTLHTSNALDDVAEIAFEGTGFVLYIQGDGKGGNWQLQIDGQNFDSIPGVTCQTQALIVTPTTGPKLINGAFRTPYTVACTGLLENELHTVRAINKVARRTLNIDAIQILREGADLRPGFYEVNHPEISPLLFGSTLLNDKTVAKVASNGVAAAITSSGYPTINIPFRGTGIAVGTALEADRALQGAVYDLCVTPDGGERVCQRFNNATGGTTRPAWGVFRPFYGYDPQTTSVLEIDIVSLPAGGRLLIDSIVVFNTLPESPLGLGVTEDDAVGTMVFANGRDDSWTLDTNNRRASNSSLTSVTKGINFAGPFVSFEIPTAADSIQWYRFASTRDSKNVLICVDRAEAADAGDQAIYCITKDLGTAPLQNPVIINESDFNGGAGWTGAGATHRVEIFSLTNLAFNVDKLVVIDSDAPLAEGYYEDFTSSINYFDETLNLANDARFTTVNNTRFSGGSVRSTTTVNSGALFQFNGTGFSVYFTLEKKADAIRICYVNSLTTNVNTVLGGTCKNFDNESAAIRYQAARSILGLDDGNYTAVVQMLADNDGGGTGETPLTMQIDAVAIYDDTLPANVLNTTGIRYETDYVNRVAQDRFQYFGAGWTSFSGARASRYSGSNYDSSPATQIGTGVLFRTNGGDRVVIYRDTRTGYAPFEVCAIRESDNLRTCTIVQNNVGTGNQVPVAISLNDTSAHTVTIVKTDYGILNLDAIELLNSTTPLGAGQYQENYPLLQFGGTTPGTWNLNFAERIASNGKVAQTTTIDDYLQFTFSGTNFQIFLAESTLTSNNYRLCGNSGTTFSGTCAQINRTFTPAPLGTAKTLVAISPLAALPNGTYTVQLINENTTALPLLVDRVDIVVPRLTRGLYEETYPSLIYNGTFTDVVSNASSGKSVKKTSTENDQLVFEFAGTGFEVGTIIDRFGSEMVVCYESGSLTGTPAQIDANCYTFQNESAATSYLVSRSIAGLADATYSVSVTLLDDDASILTNPPGGPRDNTRYPATMAIDYVRIFDEAQAPLVQEPRFYNENATNDSGRPYLQLLPAERWTTLSGNAAKLFSNQTVATIGSGGRALATYAGPLATLRVEVPAGGATVIVYTGPLNARAGDLLVCADNLSTASCASNASVVSALRTSSQVVLNSSNLAALGVAGTHTLTFRTTTPSFLRIDGFQVIHGTTLAPGLYDETLAGTLLDFSPVGAGETDWSSFKSAKAFGGNVFRSGVNNATLTFDFEGTGFSIITENSASGVDMRVCYKLESLGTAFPAAGSPVPAGITCELVTTDTTPADWNTKNVDRPLVASSFQYGFAYYGLPADVYTVEVRVVDSTIVAAREFLKIDAVGVFGDVTEGGVAAPTGPGVYDDADENLDILYGPEPFWVFSTSARSGPPRGPFNRTEHTATNAGTLAQVYVDGNALVIYQSGTSRNSSYVRVCLVVPGDDMECSEYSQNSRRAAYFTPVVIYGLGDDEHEVVIENRYPGRTFSIDGIGVLP